MAKLAANAYGDALFELTLEKSKDNSTHMDEMLQEVVSVLDSFKANMELKKLLTHPQISKEEKITVIEKIYKGRASDDIVGLLVTIVKNGRASEINAIFEYFINRVKEYNHIGKASVVSAVELTDELKKKIEEKLISLTDYKEFEMSYSVDKNILGGLIIRIGDRVVDSSLKNKINSMCQSLEKIHIS
ncbi:MAG: ATP synthase F1 subunit delta [Lachnospiraceae bacterium]|nr:ATP synthase F1 subunit delta [Lachnospiraceae bacterium]